VIAAAGLFTDNGSRAGAVGADLFMKENRYELMSFYLYGKLDYNLYNEGNLDVKLPLAAGRPIFFRQIASEYREEGVCRRKIHVRQFCSQRKADGRRNSSYTT
jgi:hypothetical protein